MNPPQLREALLAWAQDVYADDMSALIDLVLPVIEAAARYEAEPSSVELAEYWFDKLRERLAELERKLK